jgi:hypothetical protein
MSINPWQIDVDPDINEDDYANPTEPEAPEPEPETEFLEDPDDNGDRDDDRE